jgi:hypothetical protein
VRQGCNILLTLFNLYIEEVLKELREESIGGLKINVQKISPDAMFY